MAGNSLVALEASAAVAAIGAVLGLLAWAFEPEMVNIYGIEVSRMVTVFLLPAIGLMSSGFVALCVQCDPLIVSHTPESRSAVAGTIVLPSAVSLVVHVIVLVAGLARHVLGTPSLVFAVGLLIIGIGWNFTTIEQNYVIGIRDIWTLRSPSVWERTHSLGWKVYIIAGSALLVLAIFLPEGFWGIATIVAVPSLATAILLLYSYLIREDRYSYIVR